MVKNVLTLPSTEQKYFLKDLGKPLSELNTGFFVKILCPGLQGNLGNISYSSSPKIS